MRIIVLSIALFFACNAHAQQQQPDTSKMMKMVMPADTVSLLSIGDVKNLGKYLEDKLLAKDYNVVFAAVNQLLQDAIINWNKKKR